MDGYNVIDADPPMNHDEVQGHKGAGALMVDTLTSAEGMHRLDLPEYGGISNPLQQKEACHDLPASRDIGIGL
jgi:hypothetical protein